MNRSYEAGLASLAALFFPFWISLAQAQETIREKIEHRITPQVMKRCNIKSAAHISDSFFGGEFNSIVLARNADGCEFNLRGEILNPNSAECPTLPAVAVVRIPDSIDSIAPADQKLFTFMGGGGFTASTLGAVGPGPLLMKAGGIYVSSKVDPLPLVRHNQQTASSFTFLATLESGLTPNERRGLSRNLLVRDLQECLFEVLDLHPGRRVLGAVSQGGFLGNPFALLTQDPGEPPVAPEDAPYQVGLLVSTGWDVKDYLELILEGAKGDEFNSLGVRSDYYVPSHLPVPGFVYNDFAARFFPISPESTIAINQGTLDIRSLDLDGPDWMGEFHQMTPDADRIPAVPMVFLFGQADGSVGEATLRAAQIYTDNLVANGMEEIASTRVMMYQFKDRGHFGLAMILNTVNNGFLIVDHLLNGTEVPPDLQFFSTSPTVSTYSDAYLGFPTDHYAAFEAISGRAVESH